MSLEITKMFDEIKNGSIELQQFHDWLCEPYTHITDEEILKLYVNNSTYDNDQKLFIDIYGFARAILRKAQEND